MDIWQNVTAADTFGDKKLITKTKQTHGNKLKLIENY